MSFDREFQQLLLSSRTSILSKTKDSPANTIEFKRLLALLQSFSNNVGAELFTLVLDIDHLTRLDFNLIGNNLQNSIRIDLQLKNHFIVDESFNIVSTTRMEFTSSNEARQTYAEISNDKKCVLLCGKRLAYPHYFIEGVDIGNATFFTEADYKRFIELRDIGDVMDVIEEFRQELKKYSIYTHFFVPKATLRSLYGPDKTNYKGRANLLRNRPEDLLRQQLKEYLNNNINRSFNFYRETHMDHSSRRLDIIGEDERGNIYFFEVKWMGDSIGPDDIRVTSNYREEKVLSGTKQTLEYIQEWQSNKKIVKMGCLVVFDARDDKYDYETPDFKHAVQSELNKLPSCAPKFRKIADLLLDNSHPT